jgi:Ca2+-binding RTX toxin-like protein
VNCSATDAAGNTATGSFTITVVDTTAPVVGILAPITAEATGPTGAIVNYFAPMAVDLVNPLSPAVSCLPASGSLFPMGTTTVTCSATDAAGNTGTSTSTITVGDTTAPVITLLGSDPVVAPLGGYYTDAGAIAFDLVDGDLTAAIVTVNPVDTSIAGTYTITYDVIDSHGNAAAQVTRTVEVVYFCNGLEATIVGTGGDDTIYGTPGFLAVRDVIVGLGGNDTIYGLSGSDIVCGGDGDDLIYGGAGADVLIGNGGNDTLYGEAGNDTLYGLNGDDHMFGGPDSDKFVGGAGNDTADFSLATSGVTANLASGTAWGEGSHDAIVGIENLIGSAFNDQLIGNGNPNSIWGEAGDDEIWGAAGDDILWGGDGDDLIHGGAGADTIDGVLEP